jgi:hypothetical protein
MSGMGRNNKNDSIFILKIIKIGMIHIKPKIKFIKLANTDEIGMNSDGKVNCFNSWALRSREDVDSDKETEKKNHGKIPAKQNSGKLAISIFITFVKTKVIAPVIRSGVRIAHQIPNIEPVYFAFSSFRAIFQRIPLFKNNLWILCL